MRMYHSTKAVARRLPSREAQLGLIREHIAEHMIGCAVDLLVDATHIAHGVVTGVLTEAGRPKLVVDGHRYDLSQILTVAPAGFN
jgi:hypothetical protein